MKLGPLVSLSSRLKRSHPITGRAQGTPDPCHHALHAMPCGQHCGHRTPRSSSPPCELRLILTLLELEKPARLSSLLHPCSQLPRSATPCSTVPPCCSVTRFRASHRRSGYTKATSSSTARTWASSLNCWPPLGADLKPPCATTSSAESTSP
jgi:hypothetical protein